MTDVLLHSLAPDVRLKIGDPYQPPADLLGVIDAIWHQEKERRGDALTNGRLYCLDHLATDHVLIRPAEYRYLLARRRAPELVAAGLNLRTLAVTGIVLCRDGVVLGQRGHTVAVDAGLWEPAPAGGLAQPDPVRQLLEEAEEELGLSPDHFDPPVLCGLVEDCPSGVIDFLFRLPTALSADEIKQQHAQCGSDEYQCLDIVPLDQLGQTLSRRDGQMLPVLRPMLQLAGVLPG